VPHAFVYLIYWPSRWLITTGLCSAMADEGQQTALILEEKGSLRPEKENAASWPVFWPGGGLTWRVLLNLMDSIRERRPNHGPMVRNLAIGGGCRIIPDDSISKLFASIIWEYSGNPLSGIIRRAAEVMISPMRNPMSSISRMYGRPGAWVRSRAVFRFFSVFFLLLYVLLQLSPPMT